jgi:multiple sugar transport system ATP-binding protein
MGERTGRIEIRGLVKAYDDNVVLDGINLETESGELLVLVGPSGCGKSTLLRCVAGLEEITAGELLIDGRRANDVHPKDRDLAMVFQSYALYPHMTVAQNMAFSLTVRKVGKQEVARLVRETAGRLGLAGLLDRRPGQLSGGQRQRVAVGRAIVRQPRGFLFDEPLSNLDAALRGQMRVELKKLHREMDATMIYVTHDQVEAMTLADRICVLNEGRVQQLGEPTELFARPANRFVAGFIGSPAMNFLPARFEPAGPRATGEGFDLELPQEYRRLSAEPRDVVAGVRPTALERISHGGRGGIGGALDVVETLGFESHAHLRLASGRHLVVQLPTRELAGFSIGDHVGCEVDRDEVHLFDERSGVALRPDRPGGDRR